MTIKAITFDLDNTLWDVGPVIRHAESTLFQWLEQYCPNVIVQFSVTDLYQLRERILKENPQLLAQISQLRIATLTRALELSGYKQADELAAQAFEIFMHARNEIDFYPDVLSTLRLLKQSYQLGAITNGNADIQRLNLQFYFSFVFSAENIGVKKPAPALFQAAVDCTELHPSEILHVGDHHHEDIWGAQQVGLKTVWVNWRQVAWPDSTMPEADAEILSISELLTVITQLG